MSGEKYVDLAKEKVLYSWQDQADSVRLMLDQSRTNSRVNQEMGRWIMAVRGVTGCWAGRWNNLLGDTDEELQRHYLNLSAFARVQAVEMQGSRTVAERELMEKKDRGGILGLFSGK